MLDKSVQACQAGISPFIEEVTHMSSWYVSLVVAGIVSLLPLPAQACLNDRNTKSREIEFKAQYNPSPTPEKSVSEQENELTATDFVLLGTGGSLGMITLGFAIGASVTRKPM
jgi:hypothetical protein